MRPYRGYRLDNGKEVKGWYVYVKLSNRHYILEEPGLLADYRFNALVGHVEVDPATVGQQIGKQDKHGQEIYKGDKIIKDNEIYEIRYSGHGFDLASKTNAWPKREDGYSYFATSWDDIEIIGTIHDGEGK